MIYVYISFFYLFSWSTPAVNNQGHHCPGNSSKGQAMVAGVELPAGAFWRDSRCQRAARETNTKGGLYRCHGCTCRIIICPESGEKEGDRLRDPGPRAAAMERAAVCAHRCHRPVARRAVAAASRTQHSHQRAEAVAAAKLGSSSCSSFSEAGDGQRARAAQQLQIHCSPLQLPAPPSLSPPRCPPAPVALLGQRRHRRLALPASCAAQPSRAPRMALYPQDRFRM
ncbi:PREDICTED: alpha-(1,3)-fucosyltransferase 9 isoform X4 [Cercocebus atys]|uniref:alpha-(1,3)-fucosyltransferase 9 isoform X4 n=1 Tax=Cercocebus atys TaxID=9531 RepID=UPI0005F45D98|nr:PREDICTED: alpha-(1,3)-fucosyltransferase 9 isoform X4 [Cercocebus atys]